MTTITDLADVQPGDIVTWLDSCGREYSGPCYEAPTVPRALYVVGYLLRNASGAPTFGATFVRAERPVPEPPSEPGTVILVHGIDSDPLPAPLVGIVDYGGQGVHTRTGWRLLDRITSWQAVDVTPRGEVLTRG